MIINLFLIVIVRKKAGDNLFFNLSGSPGIILFLAIMKLNKPKCISGNIK